MTDEISDNSAKVNKAEEIVENNDNTMEENSNKKKSDNNNENKDEKIKKENNNKIKETKKILKPDEVTLDYELEKLYELIPDRHWIHKEIKKNLLRFYVR